MAHLETARKDGSRPVRRVDRRHRTASRVVRVACCLVLLVPAFSGCAAFRPLNGLPSRYLPDEFKAATRSGKRTIDLSLLRQTPPKDYLIDAGDVLGLYIEGVLGAGEGRDAPPVHFPQDNEVPASLGYPIPVREDGTISMPLVEPILVRGRSIQQIEAVIRKAYTQDHKILQPGRDRILVSLQRPRTYRILVIRQEAGNDVVNGSIGTLNLGTAKRGTGRVVNLPAYENDVLHALAETGGLPGLDAENAIYIIRQRKPGPVLPETSVPKPLATVSVTMPARDDPPPKPEAVSPQASTIQLIGGTAAIGTAWGHGSAPTESAIRLVSESHPSRIQRLPPPRESPVTGPAFGRYGHLFSPPATRLTPMLPADDVVQVDVVNEPNAVVLPLPSVPALTPEPVPAVRPEPDVVLPPDVREATVDNSGVIKIPVRLSRGERPTFTEQDIILHDGDIVFIESRDTEIFYTGGLLGGGQYTLPRDYDLDVLGALSIAQSQNQGGGRSRAIGGISALNQDVTIGASDVIILRQLPNGTQVPIKIDLYRALRHPEERVIIKPGDYIVLQYTRTQAIAAFIERHLLEGALFGLAASQLNTNRN